MADDRILPRMEVVGADGGHVGTVDRLEPGHLKLTRGDDPAGLGGHRVVPLSAVAAVEAGRVRLTLPAAQARAMAAGGKDPSQMEEGFAGTGAPVPSPSGAPGPEEAEERRADAIPGDGGPARQGGAAPGTTAPGGTGAGGTSGGHLGGGAGFRGDPNMDPSGRGEV